MTNSKPSALFCNLCPNTDWFELTHSVGIKFGRGSKEYSRVITDYANTSILRQYMLPEEEIYIYRDEHVVVKYDIEKVNKLHLLVITNAHLKQPAEAVLFPEIFMHAMKVALKIAENIPSKETKIHISQRPQGHDYSMSEYIEHFHIQILSDIDLSIEEIRKALN